MPVYRLPVITSAVAQVVLARRSEVREIISQMNSDVGVDVLKPGNTMQLHCMPQVVLNSYYSR